MCLGDLRFSRFVRAVIQSQALGAAGVITIPASRQRVGISFAANTTATTLTTTHLIAVDGVFFRALGLNYPAIDLTMIQFGDLVQRGFTFTNGTTPGILHSVVEYFATEDVLDAALDEFNRMRR